MSLFFSIIFAQTIKFEHHTIDNGLSHNSVKCIFQDSRGFMWIGTGDGLNMYDGYTFKTYKSNLYDSTSISDNIITGIAEDSSGILWIGTNYNGVNRFDFNTGKFERFTHNPDNENSLAHNRVWHIDTDNNNDLWIASRNLVLNKFIPQKKEFIRIKLNSNINTTEKQTDTLTFFQDKDNQFWIGTKNGLYEMNPTDYSNKLHMSIPNDTVPAWNVVFAITQDSNDDLIFGTNNGLYSFDIKNGSFKYLFNQVNNKSLSNRISSIIDDDNYLWLSTDLGLSKFNKKTKYFENYTYDEHNFTSLTNNDILTSFEDKSGVIWLGTRLGGINKYIKYAKFQHFMHGQTIGTFCETADFLWIGVEKKGLYVFEKKNKIWHLFDNDKNKSANFANNTITSIFVDSKNILWIGTWNGGLKRAVINYENPKDLDFENLLNRKIVQGIYEDKYGRLWIGCEKGWNLYNYEKKQLTTFLHDDKDTNSISFDAIQTAVIDNQNDAMWIGTWKGLNVQNIYKNTEETVSNPTFIKIFHNKNKRNSLSDNRVTALCLDSTKNIIWAGTYGGGLNRIKFDYVSNKLSYKIKHYTEFNGLPSNCIYGIINDDSNNLWISTNNGIIRFDTETENIINYDVNDGLQSNQFFWRSYYKNKQGKIYFGGINGYNTFFPKNIKNNEYIPPVAIINFRIFNKIITSETPNSPLKNHISNTKEIIINYDQSVISFEYVALSYFASHKNSYSYMMENFDKDWQDVGSQRKATYTNLDPGKYIFKVKASNSDGVWNNQGTSLKILILPPFWKTWWFRILVVITIIGSIVLIFMIRLRSINRQKKVLTYQVKQRTHQLQLANGSLEERHGEIMQQSNEILKQNDKLNQQKKELIIKNEQIRGSIRYAKTIQNAILPGKQEIDLCFQNFIIFRPRDIVSGDFYWMTDLTSLGYSMSEYISDILVAVVDCTGHGIPGAFMSLIGNGILNEIVKVYKITEPSVILEKLNNSIKQILKQDKSGNDDGMDVCLCRIQKYINEKSETKHKITFSGAKRPLYYIKNSENSLKTIKGSIKSIGGGYTEKFNFTTSTLSLDTSDVLIMTSDGYIDQANSQRKKIGIKSFTNLLSTNIPKNAKSLKVVLEEALEKHQQDENQRDDITVLGIYLD